MDFSKKHTTAIKGIAIMMMLIHHCFIVGRYEKYTIDFFPFTEKFTTTMAAFFKICVAIYAFLSAYGITIKMKEIISNEKKCKNEIIKKTVNRYLSLMFGFWFVFILSQIFCWFMNKGQITTYKFSQNRITSVFYIITDILGLSNLMETPTLNGTWWYMSLAIIIIAIVPIMFKCYKKYGAAATIFGILFFTHTFKICNSNMTRWLFVIILGIIFADKNLLVKMKEFKIVKKHMIVNKAIKFIVSSALLVFLIYVRENMGYQFPEFRDGIVPVFVIYYCYEFILPIKYLNNVLEFLGKHSINIFLTHTFIRHYYFGEFTYSFKYPVLIILVLLAISLVISIVIEFLKKVTGYNKLNDFIRKKVNMKFESIVHSEM